MTLNLTRGSDNERDLYFSHSFTQTGSELKTSAAKLIGGETASSPATLGPEVVADASNRSIQTSLSDKANGTARERPTQCAYSTSNPSLTSSASTTSRHRPSSHAKRLAGKKPSTPPIRQPRRAAAKLEKIAREKTWEGRKSKGRKDKLTEAEKFSAAVWHVAASGGVSVSLNLGFRREAMLWNVGNPRRRMMQNLHKHLSAEGFGELPYAFTFEMPSEAEGHRLHLHGVIDTSGLTDAEIQRLGVALRRAASYASGPIGGERQLDLGPVHNPAGWVDYVLKNKARTARELRIDDTILMNNVMRSLAKDFYQRYRNEVIQQSAFISRAGKRGKTTQNRS